MEFSPVPANITAVTDQCDRDREGDDSEPGTELEVHREPLQNPYVMTEPVRIREILVNILNNAVKFTKMAAPSVLMQAAVREPMHSTS